jgi:hypothetical protein
MIEFNIINVVFFWLAVLWAFLTMLACSARDSIINIIWFFLLGEAVIGIIYVILHFVIKFW